MIAFISEHKDHRVTDRHGVGLRWGVEPVCAVLTEHGVVISPSTYYEWVAKTPSARQVRDEELIALLCGLREKQPLLAALGHADE